MDLLFNLLLFLALLLPFQFALSPADGYDVAIIRLLIPIISLWALLKLPKSQLRQTFTSKLGLLLILFIAFACLSFFNAANLNWFFRKILFLLTIFPLYFLAAKLINCEKRRQKIIIALVLSGTALALLAIIQFGSQFIWGIDSVYHFWAKYSAPFFLGNTFSNAVLAYPSLLVNSAGKDYLRAVGTFPDPHMLSYFMGMLIPWSLAIGYENKKYKNWFLAASVLLIIADILTFTRGGYLALIGSALVTIPLVSKKNALKILFAIGILAILFVLVPQNPVASRLATSVDATEGSNQGRISNWQQALALIERRPLGVGIGNYALAINPAADYREPIYAHNLYLDITAEIGFQGLIIFVLLIFSGLKNFYDARHNSLAIAGFSSLAIFTIHNFVENPLYSVHVLTLLMFMFAISNSYYAAQKNN